MVKRKKGDDDDDHHVEKKKQREGIEERVISGKYTKRDLRRVKIEKHEYTNIPPTQQEDDDTLLKDPEYLALLSEHDLPSEPDHTIIEQSYWRPPQAIIQKEKEIYRQMLNQSEGFDVPHLPYSTMRCGMVAQMYLQDKGDAKKIAKCSKLAIINYNKINGTDYAFEKIKKANSQGCCGRIYYITFAAKLVAQPTNPSVTFQAQVSETFKGDNIEIMLCRIKPHYRKQVPVGWSMGLNSYIR
ncbi:hypothetical protein LguiA_022651 [Lonicera macranthoides]